jgi:hypothetical protein
MPACLLALAGSPGGEDGTRCPGLRGEEVAAGTGAGPGEGAGGEAAGEPTDITMPVQQNDMPAMCVQHGLNQLGSLIKAR